MVRGLNKIDLSVDVIMPNLLRSLPILTILLMLGGAGIAIWWLPQKQVEPLQHRIDALDSQKPTTFAELEKLAQQEKARIDAENAARAALIQGAGGLFAATAAYIAWCNLLATQEKQMAERFSKAVEQLGNDNIHVRLGGIYALEQIAKDAEENYYWRVIETLAAYVRERSPYKPVMVNQAQSNATTENERTQVENNQDAFSLSTDIQAVITILARCKPSREGLYESYWIDLRNTDLHDLQLSSHLRQIDFSGANLQRANLKYARLEDVKLHNANLQHANLSDARFLHTRLENANLKGANLHSAELNALWLENVNLQDANLEHTDLRGSSLHRANFQNANLFLTKLQNTDLSEANFQKIWFRGADLQKARLGRANLQEAKLKHINLRGAQLGGANLQGADLSEANLSDANLKEANLDGANLEAAILQRTQFSVPPKDVHLFGSSLDATGLDWEQLKQAKSYKNAVLPSYLMTPQPASAAADAKLTVDPPLPQD